MIVFLPIVAAILLQIFFLVLVLEPYMILFASLESSAVSMENGFEIMRSCIAIRRAFASDVQKLLR